MLQKIFSDYGIQYQYKDCPQKIKDLIVHPSIINYLNFMGTDIFINKISAGRAYTTLYSVDNLFEIIMITIQKEI